jgi:hypothetical protein
MKLNLGLLALAAGAFGIGVTGFAPICRRQNARPRSPDSPTARRTRFVSSPKMQLAQVFPHFRTKSRPPPCPTRRHRFRRRRVQVA